jgi:hypothetical protein
MSGQLTVYSLVKILDNHIGQPQTADPETTVQIFRSVLLQVRNQHTKIDQPPKGPKPTKKDQQVSIKLTKKERKQHNIQENQFSITQFLAFQEWERQQKQTASVPPTYSQCQA